MEYPPNEHPVAIRVPATDVITCGEPVETDYSVLNRYKVTHRGAKVAILALGSFYGLGQSVASLLKEKPILTQHSSIRVTSPV